MWSFMVVFLVWVATVVGETRDGCIAGYTPLGTKLCINVTEPGSWTETAKSCLRSSKDVDDPFFDKYDTIYYYDPDQKSSHTHGFKDQSGISDEELAALDVLINQKLVEQDYGEVWWFPNYSQLIVNGTVSPWQSKLLYPYNMPRWNSNTSVGWCYSVNKTSTPATLHSECSKPSTDSKLPGICLRPRFEQLNLIDTDSCPPDFFTGFGINPYCLTVEDKFHNGGFSYNWQQASHMCNSKGFVTYMLQQGYRSLVGRRNKFCVEDSLIPMWIKSEKRPFVWMAAHDRTEKVVADIGLQRLEEEIESPAKVVALNLTTGQWFMVAEDYQFSCVICQTMRVTGHEPAFSLQHKAGRNLTLNIFNFDSRRQDSITCHTDATITKMSSCCKETHFSFKKEEDGSVLIFEKKMLYTDEFFLQMVAGIPVEAVKPLDTIKIYSMTLEKDASLSIPLKVGGSGSYWCIGRNRITLEPLYTGTILLDIPNEGSFLRFSVLIEQAEADLGKEMELSAALAKVLNVTDGLIELKHRNRKGTRMLFHITLPANSNSSIVSFKGISVKGTFHFLIHYIRNTDFCPAEETLDSYGEGLHWARTARGKVQTHRGENNCLAAIRKCSGDLIEGAFWVHLSERDWKKEWGDACQRTITNTEANYNPSNITIIDQKEETPPTNSLMSFHTLRKTAHTSSSLPQVSRMASDVLNSSTRWQSADTISTFLTDLESILSEMTLTYDVNHVSDVTQNCALLVADLDGKNRSVVFSMMTSLDGKDTLELNKVTKSPLNEQTVISVELPQSITSQNKRVAFAVFANGNMFQSNSSDQVTVKSKVITIILSSGINKTKKFIEGQYIDIKFRTIGSQATTGRKQCAFWDIDEGAWSTEGCILLANSSYSLDVCRCYHLTSFAEVIIGNQNNIAKVHQTALDVISIAGCTLSLLGFLIIAVTAIVFKKWRAELGNKILLNLTATMALNLVMYLLIDVANPSRCATWCVVHGAVLHYSLIACFCWMLVMAILQLLRLLTMHGNQVITCLLVKAAAFGWGVPLMPVIFLLAWNPHSYIANTPITTRRFCFPDGLTFYVTVLVPVAFIVLINIAVYVTIMCRIYSCFGWGGIGVGLQRHGIQDRTITVRRLGTSIFLFFLFGLTWAFGLFAHISVFTTVFSYLFCITATLQGFVMFVFFFIIEKKSRSYWQNFSSKPLHTSEYQSIGTKSTTLSENDVPLQGRPGDATIRRLQNNHSAQSSTHTCTEEC